MSHTKTITTLILLIATSISFLVSDALSADLTKEEISFAQKVNNAVGRAANIASPAVVSLVIGDNGNLSDTDIEGIGSGCIITEQGHIVTNNHLVENTKKVRVILADGREYITRKIMLDPDTDLAVIKIDPKGLELPVISFGDSDDSQVGDFVLAIGNPFGMLSQTVTSGIISFKGRKTHILGPWGLEDFIQTDAVINKGNSGGPLVNLYGEVIGINSNIYSLMGHATGYGFAIPSNTAKYVCEQLIKFKKIKRGYIGVAMSPLTLSQIRQKVALNDRLAPGITKLIKRIPVGLKGVLVQKVYKNTPASKAKMKDLDILQQINDTQITSKRQASQMIARFAPKVNIKCKIWRNGKEITLEVTLGRREHARKKITQTPKALEKTRPTPTEPTKPIEQISPAINQPVKLGIRQVLLTPQIALNFGYPQTKTGIIITNVVPNSIAAKSGLKNGDIIKAANDTPTPGTQAGRAVLLFLVDQAKRNHGTLILDITNNLTEKSVILKMP